MPRSIGSMSAGTSAGSYSRSASWITEMSPSAWGMAARTAAPLPRFCWLTRTTSSRPSRQRSTMSPVASVEPSSTTTICFSRPSAETAEWIEQGRRFRERRHFMGRTAELELEVTALELDRRFDVRTVNAPVTFAIRHSFEAVEAATRLRVHGEAKLGGALRVAAGMAKRQAERQLRHDFDRLKEMLERRDEESPSDRPPRLAKK